jgi:hypothetical protein
MLRGLLLAWDGVNQWWQANVVEYDLRTQLNLLRWLGIDSPGWQHLGWGFGLGLLAWVAWIALTLRRSVGSSRHDEISKLWLLANRKFARVALPRQPSEGPMDYAARIGAARPDLAALALDIAQRYATVRFGANPGEADIAAFRRAVNALNIWSRDRRAHSAADRHAP